MDILGETADLTEFLFGGISFVMRLWLFLPGLLALAASDSLFAQNVMTTVGGTDRVVAVPIPAKEASLGAIASVAIDPAGNLYIADVGRNLVLKITPEGSLDAFLGKVSKFDSHPDICLGFLSSPW